MLLVASPVHAEKDAAIKAREGDINHWIDYYRRNHAPAAAPPVTPQSAVGEKAEEREKRKEKRGSEAR
jgi:hypothetical protein